MNAALLDMCATLQLPQVVNRAGSITAINELVDIPFRIARVYYLYDVPGGAARGGHAHRVLNQVVVAASGSFDVLLDDGFERRKISLNRPHIGLHIVPGVWRELINFSSGGICLVLASLPYDPGEYIRGYENYLRFRDATRCK